MNKILDANKFDKVQYPFLIKVLTKQGIEEKILNTIKTLHKILTANLIFNCERQNFPSKIRNKDDCFCHFNSA